MSGNSQNEAFMNVIYSGKSKDFTPVLEEKVSGKLARLSKFIEQRGEREAHVTHCLERRLHKIKIVVNFYDRALVGEDLDPDLETALCNAVCKLETQVVELKSRWRDTHRDAKTVRSAKENAGETDTLGTVLVNGRSSNGTGAARKPRVHRVNVNDGHKPMTLEEAMLEMDSHTEYVAYRDSNKNCLSVLVRRADGDYDLVET
jgi:ribosomal subunit interface protein